MNESKTKEPNIDTDQFLRQFVPGDSQEMQRLREDISILNQSKNIRLVNAVLITGETGAGKGHIARVLAGHRRWLNRTEAEQREQFALEVTRLDSYCGRFRSFPLTGITDTLAESELFGWKKGAHSEAKADRDGLLACEGRSEEEKVDDILLDEIGDASSALQAKLLDPIENREFKPLGSTEAKEVQARLLFATWHDLPKLIRSDPPKFRQDLYFRITAKTLHVPALRDRLDTLPDLTKRILFKAEHIRERHKPNEINLDEIVLPNQQDLAWAMSGEYKWPGNVRELQHSLHQWLIHDRSRSLKEIVEFNSALFSTVQSDDSDKLLRDAVESRLDQICDGQFEQSEGPTQLADQFLDEVKVAIACYCEKHRITHRNPGALFEFGPDKQNAVRQALKKFKELR